MHIHFSLMISFVLLGILFCIKRQIKQTEGMKSNKKTGKEREYEDHEKTPGYEENLIDEDGNYAFKPVEKMENISNKTREKFGNLYLKLVDKNIKKSGKMCHSQNEKIVKCLKISSYLIMFLIILLIIKKKKLN